MNRLVLIDGNAIMHRAYHALPPLTTRDGQPINAVYGFTSMLLRIIQDLKPAAIIVTFDRPEPTFRKKLFSDYQSHRPEMDHTLSSQFTLVKDVVSAMKIPILEKAGYEADDVIGTIATRVTKKIDTRKLKVDLEGRGSMIKKKRIYPPSSNFKNQSSTFHRLSSNIEVIIVTGDRDILQLVNDHVKVYMPVKGLSEAKMYGCEEVIEKFGLPPEQIPDYKALIGDSSDNYPGVNGIGPKTAVTLLSRYKTIEALYDHLDKEKNAKVVGKLKNGEKDAAISKKLATIVCDVPIDVDFTTFSPPIVDSDEVMDLFEKLEFHSLMKRLMVEQKDESRESKVESTRLRRSAGKAFGDVRQGYGGRGKKDKKNKKEENNQLSLL